MWGSYEALGSFFVGGRDPGYQYFGRNVFLHPLIYNQVCPRWLMGAMFKFIAAINYHYKTLELYSMAASEKQP